jgi:hypothetical protein
MVAKPEEVRTGNVSSQKKKVKGLFCFKENKKILEDFGT